MKIQWRSSSELTGRETLRLREREEEKQREAKLNVEGDEEGGGGRWREKGDEVKPPVYSSCDMLNESRILQ